MTSSLLDRKKIYDCWVLGYAKLAGNGAQIEKSNRKFLHQLAVDSGASKYSVHRTAKLLKLYSCKIYM
jgi:hypothetical protein